MPVGTDDVYDLEVQSENHNFVADGFVVHNCEFKFHHVMPIFVARQWIRHRTASVNEYSARYSVVRDRFYRPGRWTTSASRAPPTARAARRRSTTVTAQQFLDYLDRAEGQYAEYERLMAAGVSRELARIALPVSAYTEWYWKCDLHNTAAVPVAADGCPRPGRRSATTPRPCSS